MNGGAANRVRGAVAERAVTNYLRLHGWPDARRYLAGDGRQPGDIDCWPGIALEVKDRAQSAWPTWRMQATVAAGPKRIPVVVRRHRGVPDVGRWPTEMPYIEWVGLGGNPRIQTVDCNRTAIPWAACAFSQFTDLLHEEVA